jgi:hypothetical protein
MRIVWPAKLDVVVVACGCFEFRQFRRSQATRPATTSYLLPPVSLQLRIWGALLLLPKKLTVLLLCVAPKPASAAEQLHHSSGRKALDYHGSRQVRPFKQNLTETRQPMGSAALKNFRFAKGFAGV